MIIAVGLFYFFARVGLVGTAAGLVLGHTVLAVPYVVMTMMAVLKNYDDAARPRGAEPRRAAVGDAALRDVSDPRGRMFSSFLFAFTTSFDELTIALFASGGLQRRCPSSSGTRSRCR